MDQQSTIRFHGGPSHPRTHRISKEAWERHEPTIRALYPSTTLRGLMDIMETQHGFKATEKQYIYQLPKWGLHKRGVKQDAPTGQSPANVSSERDPPQPMDPGGQERGGRDSPPSPLTSTPGTQTRVAPFNTDDWFQAAADLRLCPNFLHQGPPPEENPRGAVSKRPRSIASLKSQVSATPAGDGHKRFKAGPWTESPVASPDAQETTGFTTSASVSPCTQYLDRLRSPDDDMNKESPLSPNTTVYTSTSRALSRDPPETSTTTVPDTPKDTMPIDMTTFELHQALETATPKVFRKELSENPQIRVSERHKLMLHMSRVAEELFRRGAFAWSGAKETRRVLRSAAEYLQAINHWREAFYLYAFLLGAAEEEKQQQPQPQPEMHRKGATAGPPPPWSLVALFFACATAAGTPEECAMVRTWPASAPAAAFYGYQRFLQHGIFADMYGRADLRAEAAHEATEARRLLASACTFGTPTIAGVRFGRNADLVAYSYLVRFGSDAERATFAGYDRFVHRVWEAPVHGTAASDADDSRDPLADLRSVLRWCLAATNGEDIFSIFSEIDEANSALAPTPDSPGHAALDPRALGLFHCLFDRWIQLRDPAPMLSPTWSGGDGKKGEELWLWMQTQERMGLAPTEFLVVLCEMITEAGGGGSSSDGGGGVVRERSPVSYTAFMEQLGALEALPDTALADLFLSHFYARQTLGYRTGLPEEPPPSPSLSVRSEDDEHGVAIPMPTIHMDPSASAAEAGHGSRAAAADDPDDDARSRSVRSALAPSYASSDMSSLRRMALRARHLVRNPAVASAAHEPPSRVLRRSSLTVSELSERFGESMSIGSSRGSLWGPRSRQR